MAVCKDLDLVWVWFYKDVAPTALEIFWCKNRKMLMIYPDGSTIRVGDLIWWDEGLCIGYVQAIVESKEEYKSWGLDAPHIFLSNTHPFDSKITSGVCYNRASFDDEGIGLLNPEERKEFDQAILRAKKSVVADYSTYAVTTEIQHSQQIGWIFTFFKDGKEVEVIKIPVQK